MSKESMKESVTKQGPLGPNERWSLRRKREVVLRLLRGEPKDALKSYRLEQWRAKADLEIDEALRDRTGDPLQAELDVAKRHIGKLSMENEVLRCFRGKRLVIWEFAARELAQGDWRTGLVTKDTLGQTDPRGASDQDRQDNLKAIETLVESQGGWAAWYHRLEPLQEAINLKLAKSRGVIQGEEGWLFQGLLTEFQTIPVTEHEYAAWREDYKRRLPDGWTPGLRSSTECIVDTARQLEAAGVHVLFVPIPQKAEVYPEMLAPGLDPGIPASPQRYKVMQLLAEKGVRVVDLLPALMREKESAGLPLYPKHDIHWRDAAVRTAARQIAGAVRPLLGEADAGAFPAVSGMQEIATKCDDPLARQAGIALTDAEQEPDLLQAVTDADGNPYDHAAYPDAPVLVIGDSFMMGCNRGASLAAHLARELGVPVQGHYQQNGAQNVPAIFAREGESFWAGRKVVVWYGVSGMLGRYWKPVAFTDADPGPAQDTRPVQDDARGGRLRARVTLKAMTPVPSPADIAPYTENLTVFEYQVDEVLFGYCDLPTLYVAHWGVRDGKAVAETRNARVGDIFELHLELLSAHPELEGVNVADAVVTDFARPLLFEVAGLACPVEPLAADLDPLGLSADAPAGRSTKSVSSSQAEADSPSFHIDTEALLQNITHALQAKIGAYGGMKQWRQDISEPLSYIRSLVADEKIVLLKNDYLASVGNLQMARASTYAYADASRDNMSGAYEVMRDTCRQLQQLGMRVIVAPVPTRSVLIPDALFPDAPPGRDICPAYTELLLQLTNDKIETIDLMSPLLAHIETKGPVFLRTDHHWNADGIACAAKTIAAQLLNNQQTAPSQNHPLQSDLMLEQTEITIPFLGSYWSAAPEEMQSRMRGFKVEPQCASLPLVTGRLPSPFPAGAVRRFTPPERRTAPAGEGRPPFLVGEFPSQRGSATGLLR